MICLHALNLDDLSYNLRHKATNETSQQSKSRSFKTFEVVEAFRDASTRIENQS